MYRTEDGDYKLETGDPYFDKWEEERAAGIDPDLTEMFSKEEMDWYRKRREATGDAMRHLAVQEAADKATSRQWALAEKLMPTFGGDK